MMTPRIAPSMACRVPSRQDPQPQQQPLGSTIVYQRQRHYRLQHLHLRRGRRLPLWPTSQNTDY